MIITLTTDFGLEDSFVGVMKGVIYNISPNCRIVDICHYIPPQDILKGYLTVESVYQYFPKDALHVIVVDPTVGSDRKIIYVESEKGMFLAPDNGILSFLDRNTIKDIRHIKNDKYFLAGISNTFHGRDIFAPVAAHLANGISPEKLGRKIDYSEIEKITFPGINLKGNILMGKVIDIDKFGNIITNISKKVLSNIDLNKIHIKIGKLTIEHLSEYYSQVSEGAFLALFNSVGLLEIACNKGNASKILEYEKGKNIIIHIKV